ncbi:MAG: energy transducer TonB [Candidatus Krumholzibacteriota bacterium]|nr:energy transducer TonB [Candidatus Krumholzibacteriota bacterium]
MGKIVEYDRKLTKRLILTIPIALITLLLLLFSAERSRVVDRIFSVGYEGEERFVPEITIIDDRGIEAEVFSEERHDIVVREMDLVSEEEEDIEEENPRISTAPEKEIEEITFDEVIDDNYVRTYPSHTDVPYRQDYVILRMIQPEYPQDAMLKRSEGYVLVEVYINERGLVDEAYVRKVFGMKSFEEASIKAVRQFEFKPVIEDGTPRSFWISFLISFRLTG